MLLNLHIRNYALIEDLRLEFTPGLNIFTGETGAGKSIVVESLHLILGARASSQTVRKGTDRCSIAGEFDGTGIDGLPAFLEEAGLPADETLILRREIDASGRSRAFVNDRPASLATLSAVGDFLVEVHGQHEHQKLLAAAYQRRLLDGFGGTAPQLERVGALYREWKDLTALLESRRMSEQERERLIDLYSFQLKEIDDARLSPGEEEEIEQRLPQLKNAERLRELSAEAYHLLYESDGAILSRIARVQRLGEQIEALGGTLGETAENLKNAGYLLEETARGMEEFRDGLRADPALLNELLDRQALIRKLTRKYGRDAGEILAYRDTVAADLDALQKSDRDRQDLERRSAEAREALESACAALTAVRKKAAGKLSAAAEKELRELGMKKARFEVSVAKGSEPGPEGRDTVDYLFSANPGEDLKPLKQIASGGEMSRVMLALKTVLARADLVPSLVFDEVDAGIGGPTGQVVGRKLKTLAAHHQVLCITHLPQIAAFGDRHLFVGKETRTNRTFTSVRSLSEGERVEEIARMISGEAVTAAARDHARELIRQSI